MPEGGSRRRRGLCSGGQPLADCDFNRAALHPAYPIKCRTSTQRTQAPESVDTRRASALDPLENAIRKQRPFIDGGANWSIRPSVLQDRRDERGLRARRPTSAGGDMRVIRWPATPNSQRNPIFRGAVQGRPFVLAPPFSDPIGRDGAHLQLDHRGSDNLPAFEIAMR